MAKEVPVNRRKKGLKLVAVRLEPAQVKVLRAEALRRMTAAGSSRLDQSEVVREALDAYFRRRKG